MQDRQKDRNADHGNGNRVYEHAHNEGYQEHDDNDAIYPERNAGQKTAYQSCCPGTCDKGRIAASSYDKPHDHAGHLEGEL